MDGEGRPGIFQDPPPLRTYLPFNMSHWLLIMILKNTFHFIEFGTSWWLKTNWIFVEQQLVRNGFWRPFVPLNHDISHLWLHMIENILLPTHCLFQWIKI